MHISRFQSLSINLPGNMEPFLRRRSIPSFLIWLPMPDLTCAKMGTEKKSCDASLRWKI